LSNRGAAFKSILLISNNKLGGIVPQKRIKK
jgi:hypothetical protein